MPTCGLRNELTEEDQRKLSVFRCASSIENVFGRSLHSNKLRFIMLSIHSSVDLLLEILVGISLFKEIKMALGTTKLLKILVACKHYKMRYGIVTGKRSNLHLANVLNKTLLLFINDA